MVAENPAALVSPRTSCPVHGAGLRRLRRREAGLRPGRHVAPQPDAAPWPDAQAFEHMLRTASSSPLKLTGTMAFMFETRFPAARDAMRPACRSCRRTTQVLDGPQEAFRPEPTGPARPGSREVEAEADDRSRMHEAASRPCRACGSCIVGVLVELPPGQRLA